MNVREFEYYEEDLERLRDLIKNYIREEGISNSKFYARSNVCILTVKAFLSKEREPREHTIYKLYKFIKNEEKRKQELL